MPMSKTIRPLLGFSRAPDSDVLLRGLAVYKNMNGNPAFPSPPVDLAVFKYELDRFSACLSRALDKGRKAIAEKNSQRKVVIRMLEQLGHYVEHCCNNDVAKFMSSGFEALPTSPAPPQLVPQPTILKIAQGKSGHLLVWITPLYRKAIHYEIRYAEIAGNEMPETWTMTARVSARAAAHVKGLTPGVTYAFQVRAFGRLGYTNWSDSVTRMCI